MEKSFYIVICWLLLVYANGLLYFLQGFLLTRREVHMKSIASDGISCCLDAKYNQIIILLIDALRYDFIKYNNYTNEKNIPSYQNNLPVIQQLMKDSHGALYKFVADPPTSTMQRLKGITTGSLPTFIDVGSNFASDELLEDNILHQLTSLGYNITFMGDDTWIGLFPKTFHHSYPFPSFDVWDIHTVDQGVELHLLSEIEKPGWNVIIAHCLGVDHVGHRYGPEHSVMPLKLKEMNSLIERIINKMNSETLLIVMGDHGMTRNGDHGGDSQDEINAGLFAYSPRWNIKQNHSNAQVISQVDLVPTLSLLMGVPIPYSNLGSVIVDFIYPEHLWQHRQPSEEHKQLITLHHFCNALYLNVNQVWRYLLTYSRDSNFLSEKFQELSRHFGNIQVSFNHLKMENCSGTSCTAEQKCCPNKEDLEEFIRTAQHFLSETKEMCRSVWARFDLESISIGLTIFATALILHSVTLCGYKSFTPGVIEYFSIITAFFSFMVPHQFTLYAFASSLIMALLHRLKPWLLPKFRLDILIWLAPFIMAASYFSNSFVVEEPYIVHYLAQTLIWIPFVFQRKTKFQWILGAALSVITRGGLMFFRCREEQFPNCVWYDLHRNPSSFSGSSWVILGRLLLALVSLLICYKLFLNNYRVVGKTQILAIIILFYWILQNVFFLFGIDTSALDHIPKIFYLFLILNFIYDVYQLLLNSEVTKALNSRRKSYDFIAKFSLLAILLAGDGLAPAIILTISGIVIFPQVFPECTNFGVWPLYGMLSLHGFFTSGHHTSLASIPWETAFVGFSHSNSPSVLANVLPVFLVSYSTAFSLLLHALAVPLIVLSKQKFTRKEEIRIRLINGWLSLLFFHAVRLFGCMGAAALHRRHLMVWKIFAPRLLYELLFAIYTSLGVIASVVHFQVTV